MDGRFDDLFSQLPLCVEFCVLNDVKLYFKVTLGMLYHLIHQTVLEGKTFYSQMGKTQLNHTNNFGLPDRFYFLNRETRFIHPLEFVF